MAVLQAPVLSRGGWLPFSIVAMAASLGGLAAFSELLAALPATFPAPILIVEHRTPEFAHLLIDLLQRRTALRVQTAGAGEVPRAGTVYVAPADRQLVVTAAHQLRLEEPAAGAWPIRRCTADPFFRSVAAVYGERAIAVVLSGTSDDGSAGAQAIKSAGGRVLVQDVASAAAVQMPQATLSRGCWDFAFPPRSLAHALVALTMVPGAAQLFRVADNPWRTSPAVV